MEGRWNAMEGQWKVSGRSWKVRSRLEQHRRALVQVIKQSEALRSTPKHSEALRRTHRRALVQVIELVAREAVGGDGDLRVVGHHELAAKDAADAAVHRELDRELLQIQREGIIRDPTEKESE